MFLCFQNIYFNRDVLAVSAWYQVINDLLDPTGQNLRVREDAQVSCYIPILIEFFFYSCWFHLFLCPSVIGESLTPFSFVLQCMDTDISSHFGMWSVCIIMYYV